MNQSDYDENAEVAIISAFRRLRREGASAEDLHDRWPSTAVATFETIVKTKIPYIEFTPTIRQIYSTVMRAYDYPRSASVDPGVAADQDWGFLVSDRHTEPPVALPEVALDNVISLDAFRARRSA